MTTVLITGAAGGIGSAVARRLADRGDSVVLADVDTDSGEALAAEIGGLFVRTDVAVPTDNERAVAAAVEAYGGLDAAIFSAAVPGGAGLTDFTADAYRASSRVNVDGVVYGLGACWEPLRARRGTALVVSSIAGLLGSPDVFYSTAKHALIGLGRGAAMSQPDGIRVNALCPGLVDTAMLAPMRETIEATGLPIADPAEVATAAETILSRDSTGEIWAVSAGRAPRLVPLPDVDP